MTSERRIAANRINAQKSCGPRTRAGKARASRNAMRHGLAAITHRDPQVLGDIEQLAKAICADDKDPLLFEQALVIAEKELLLRLVGVERVAVVERARDPQTIALARGDNSLALAKAKAKEMKRACDELEKVRAKVDSMSNEEIFKQLDAIDEKESAPPNHCDNDVAVEERDEIEALHEAMPDLQRLARYKRRAVSRRKRAVREYIEIMSRSEKDDGKIVGREPRPFD